MNKQVCFRENSIWASIAARVLGVVRCAMVIDHTIHLHGATEHEIRSDVRWMRHEAAHVLQYRRFGMWQFLMRYAWFSLRYGYHNNPLEAEARMAESDAGILGRINLREKSEG